MGKITINQMFYDLRSNLMVKWRQSKKKFYPKMSAVAAGDFQTRNLSLKKCSKLS